MTTTANSFLANGPATIGLEARVSFSPHPFKFGAPAVGRSVGVVGTTSDLAAIPSANPLAGVYGASMWGRGLEGSGMTGVRGDGVSGPGVEGFSNHNSGVSGAAESWPSTSPPTGFDCKLACQVNRKTIRR